MVLELKNRPRPRSPSFTTPVAVMNTFAGFMSERKKKFKSLKVSEIARKATLLLTTVPKRILFTANIGKI